MSLEPKMFRIDPETHTSQTVKEVEFSELGFQERRDIQKWIANNPGILGDDLLIISEEFNGFDKISERPDLLAVDYDGRLVIIELKRDDTGADAHWQAIKYASYLSRATTDDIIDMLSVHDKCTKSEAAERLTQHLGADDLAALNNDQRIILASHRFAPQVTSAVLWINEKAPAEDLITCIQLTPYQDLVDGIGGVLYVQASTIIPLPGIDDYVIGIGESTPNSSSFGSKYGRTVAQNKNDQVAQFLRKVSGLTTSELASVVKPENTSRWASQCTWDNASARRYHWWYSRSPWSRASSGASYRVTLLPDTDAAGWSAFVEFWNGGEILDDRIIDSLECDGKTAEANRVYVRRSGNALDDDFAEELATTLKEFVQSITRVVDELEEEANQQEVGL